MTFAAFKDALRADLWPEGVPDELWYAADLTSPGPLQKRGVDGLFELQRGGRRLQQHHRDIIPFCATLFECSSGLTVASAPRGRITRVVTLADDCCEAHYHYTDRLPALQEWSGEFVERYARPNREADLPIGVASASAERDKDAGRARFGFFTLYQGRLYLGPWIQSTERIGVDWEGYKRSWLESDEVDDDPELFRAVCNYGWWEYLKRWPEYANTDLRQLEAAEAAWLEARANLIIDENLESVPDTPEMVFPSRRRLACTSCTEVYPCDDPTAGSEASDSSQVFAVVSDFGTDLPEDPEEVAALVAGWSPQFIATTGDNIQEDAGEGDYVELVKPLYGAYITGHLASTRFFPALGNHDLNDASLADYQAFFTLPGNERYYQVRRGFVELFILNSNSSEPAGRSSTSAQAKWLEAMAALSSAPWKIALFHHPPYSSVDGAAVAALQWDFKKLGLDLVLSGHAHVYERLVVNGLTYLVCGLGGAALTSFGTVSPYSQYRYASEHGALKITASCQQLLIEPTNTDGNVIETVTLTK